MQVMGAHDQEGAEPEGVMAEARSSNEMLPRFVAAMLCAILLCMTPARTPAQTVQYIHTDVLGSVVAVTDENRNVIERREYESYGAQLTPAIADGPGYAGHVQDAATGLSYLQQRYYDPELGRFLSVDPITANANTGGNFNRYKYANNNPYKFTDPDGRAEEYAGAFGAALGYILGHSGDDTAGLRTLREAELAAGNIAGAADAVDDAAAVVQVAEAIVEGGGVREVAGAVTTAAAGAIVRKKQRNAPPGPDPAANGKPHSRIEKPGPDGQYTTHNGDGTYKQYRGSGQDHGGIPRPIVKETKLNTAPDGQQYPSKPEVRPARPNEVPRG